MHLSIISALIVYFLLKLLNWKVGKNILWKAYKYDSLLDATFFICWVLFAFLFN